MRKMTMLIVLFGILLFSINCIQAANNTQKTSEAKKLIDLDTDKDGLNDAWEIALSTNLNNSDTDSDGYKDGREVMSGHNPKSKDTKPVEKVIKVDLTRQKLAYYFGDRKLEEFFISSGIKSMPTPKGEFKILDKVPVKVYGGKGYNFYYPNTKWNLHFYTGKLRFYIHGAYWHNNFGKPASHGCVNVSYENMNRLYDWAQVGTKVVIY